MEGCKSGIYLGWFWLRIGHRAMPFTCLVKITICDFPFFLVSFLHFRELGSPISPDVNCHLSEKMEAQHKNVK